MKRKSKFEMVASSKAKCDGSLDQTGGSGIRNNVIFGDS